jgi:hypothetical protein
LPLGEIVRSIAPELPPTLALALRFVAEHHAILRQFSGFPACPQRNEATAGSADNAEFFYAATQLLRCNTILGFYRSNAKETYQGYNCTIV